MMVRPNKAAITISTIANTLIYLITLSIKLSFYNFGAQGGNRTRTTFGQGILSPSRLPIPPLALIFIYAPALHHPVLPVLYYIYEANCNSSRRIKL